MWSGSPRSGAYVSDGAPRPSSSLGQARKSEDDAPSVYYRQERLAVEKAFPPWKRLAGVLSEWNGDFGWIEPMESINHRDLERTGGLLHVAQKDFLSSSLAPTVGEMVTFTIFTDSSGLGAHKVSVAAAGAEADGGGAPPSHRIKLSTGQEADADALKADLGNAKRQILKRMGTVPLLAAFAKKAKVSVNPSRAGVDDKGLPKASRQRITPSRVGGTVTQWDGQQGTITPHDPIAVQGTQVLELPIRKEDVMPRGTELAEEIQVTFFAYRDDSGYGAESCMIYKGSMLHKPDTRRVAKTGDDWWSEQRSADAAWDVYGPCAMMKGGPWDWDMQGSHWGGKGGKWGGKGGKWGKATARPQPGERKRVTEAPIFGALVEWRGKFGWIQPEEPVDHPEASFHRGRIFLSIEDAPEGKPAEVGAQFNFHVYADGSGLGAEDVIQVTAELLAEA